VASAGPYANHLHLAPDRQPRQHLITQIFTGRMLFLTPSRQCQSADGKNIYHRTTTTTTTTILRLFVRDYPGEPVPEETFTHPPS